MENQSYRLSAWLLASRTLLSGIGWMFLGQFLGRIARLLTTLVVARMLSPEHFGLAALALTTNEIANVIARFGSTQAIVHSLREDLNQRCKTAWNLNWIIGAGLFTTQCLLAFPIAQWYESPELIWPIFALAFSFLLLPLGSVNLALTLRRGDMRNVAKADVLQAVCDMLLTVGMALAGFGVWSLILPKVLVIPIWITVHRSVSPWKPSGFSLDHARAIMTYSQKIIGVELLTVLRHSIDYLIIGAFLGVEALGVYVFAFNAGFGITKGLIAAFSTALFPNLCADRGSLAELNRKYLHGAKVIALIITVWVVVQTSTASIYVPVVFGQKWVDFGALPILIIICLSGIPVALAESGSQYLRARGMPNRDLRWNLPFTIIFTLAIFIGINWGLQGTAIAILFVHLLNLPLYFFFNIMPVMKNSQDDHAMYNKEVLNHA